MVILRASNSDGLETIFYDICVEEEMSGDVVHG